MKSTETIITKDIKPGFIDKESECIHGEWSIDPTGIGAGSGNIEGWTML